MTEQVPSLAVDGAVSSVEVIPNPPVGMTSDPLGFLFNNILMPVGTAVVKAKAEQEIAIGKAKAQAQVNAYHVNNPSLGPNDPKAALAYESQTLAQRYLPSWMLAAASTVVTTPGGTTVEQKKVSLVGWAVLAMLGAGILWLVVRLFRK